jgi:hypothetical protein
MTPNLVESKLMELCNEQREAVDFILNLWNLFVVWDDAVDQDKATPERQINASMMWGMFGLHDCKFFREHEAVLRPAIFQGIAAWIVANKFEKSGDKGLIEQAYFMRCSPYDIFSTVVLLTSGFQRQIEAIEYFRSMAPEDSLASYMKEHHHGLGKESTASAAGS